jgi:hypothetical protein
VQRCHNLNRLLTGLTPASVNEGEQASLFPEARNFK